MLPTSSAGYWSPSELVFNKHLRRDVILRRSFFACFYAFPAQTDWESRPAQVSNRQPSPLPPHTEDIELRIIAEQRDILMDCLSRQHPVEGVFVVAGKEPSPNRVFRRDRE